MNESMEALKKQNEDLATRLTATEGRNGQRDQEHEQSRMREQERTKRCARICWEKRPIDREDHESSTHDNHYKIV